MININIWYTIYISYNLFIPIICSVRCMLYVMYICKYFRISLSHDVSFHHLEMIFSYLRYALRDVCSMCCDYMRIFSNFIFISCMCTSIYIYTYIYIHTYAYIYICLIYVYIRFWTGSNWKLTWTSFVSQKSKGS